MNHKKFRRIVFVLIYGTVLAACSLGMLNGEKNEKNEKIKITNINDLPRHIYKIEGSVTKLLKSDDEFAKFSKKLRSDIENTLSKYQIDDATTRQKYFRTLLTLNLLDNRFDDALKMIEKIQSLEDKEALRLMTGLISKVFIRTHKETGKQLGDSIFLTTFQKHLENSLEELPWDIVQDDIKQMKGGTEILSETLVLGLVKSQLDPVVAKSGEIGHDLADSVANFEYALRIVLPLKQPIVDASKKVVDAHKVVKKNVWLERDYSLDGTKKYDPVTVAVWDAGVDIEVFKNQLVTNSKEKLDGKDNDDNGFIDDIHGIAFDVNGKVTPDLLHPEGDMAGRVADAMNHMKGFMDIQASIDSEEASTLKRYISSLKPDQVNRFIEGLRFYGQYSHGTHVAGIVVKGNPFAKILITRITFDYHSIPKPLTIKSAKQHAESYIKTVKLFKQHNVRVANMSWGWSLREIELALEANNVGENAEARGKLASEILSILSKGLYDAIKSCPEILFVSAAGNSDNDVSFDSVIPSSFVLPNLMIVGAVDQAGDPTSFTSSGKNVVVYANGFEVESFVPGGDRMKMSGTSMASPNVVNLAAKLFTIKPTLTPTRVIDLIKQEADKKQGTHPFLLLNPKATVALLKE